MLKIVRGYIGAMVVITLAIAFVFLFGSKVAITEGNSNTIVLTICILALIITIAFIVALMIVVIRGGLKNIKPTTEEPFACIDRYKDNWEVDKQLYIEIIQIINLCYASDGMVSDIVKEKKIDKLYSRLDHISNQIYLYDYLMGAFCSLAISMIASLLVTVLNNKNPIVILLGVVVFVMSFFAVIMIKYYEKGRVGSFLHFVDVYEKKLLEEKIYELEKNLITDVENAKLLTAKKNVIDELRRIRKKRKMNRQDVTKDIESISRLDLTLDDPGKYYIRNIRLNETECCLAYKTKGEEGDRPIGKEHLVENYYALYEVLDKYDISWE